MPQDRIVEKTGGILPQYRSTAVIALGSNQPFGALPIPQTVQRAVADLGAEVDTIRAESRLFRTPAFPADSGPEFVNAVVMVETEMTAMALLSVLHEVEDRFGRRRKKRWGPRTLDLDLICYGDLVLPDLETYHAWAGLPPEQQVTVAPENLVLPHPRMHERAFVLVPMLDVAPCWRHPVTGLTTRQMVDALPDALCNEVQPL